MSEEKIRYRNDGTKRRIVPNRQDGTNRDKWGTGHGYMSGQSGPKKRKVVVKNAFEVLLESDFFDGWKLAHEVATEINKGIPNHWKQVTGHSAGALLRKYVDSHNLIRGNGQNGVLMWKVAEPMGEIGRVEDSYE